MKQLLGNNQYFLSSDNKKHLTCSIGCVSKSSDFAARQVALDRNVPVNTMHIAVHVSVLFG